MDILSNKYLSTVFRPVPISSIVQTMRVRVDKLIGFFTLSEEDKLTAGIDVTGEGRDDHFEKNDNSSE
jgi:hypothetical protein